MGCEAVVEMGWRTFVEAGVEHFGLSNMSFGSKVTDVSGSSPGPSSGFEVFVPGRQDGFGQNPVYRSANLVWAHRSRCDFLALCQTPSNKAGADNGARALSFHVGHLWRAVPGLIR